MNLVVTVPKWFWPEWIAEGDPAGTPASGEEWGFFLGGAKPPIRPGDRLYIVAHDRLRGYAPVTRLAFERGRWVICRQGGAVACTIAQHIRGFQGFRKVWWRPEDEMPLPDWRTP
ncbi:MAG TPA: hypothetical protein VMQ76_07265 [Terracidiphilus sp.]|nr:hypothetical protein [Terracidiphilus sp.]